MSAMNAHISKLGEHDLGSSRSRFARFQSA